MLDKAPQLPETSNRFYGLGIRFQGFKKKTTIMKILMCFLNKYFFVKILIIRKSTLLPGNGKIQSTNTRQTAVSPPIQLQVKLGLFSDTKCLFSFK